MNISDVGYGVEFLQASMDRVEALALESGMRYPLWIAWQSASGVGKSLIAVSPKKMVGDVEEWDRGLGGSFLPIDIAVLECDENGRSFPSDRQYTAQVVSLPVH